MTSAGRRFFSSNRATRKGFAYGAILGSLRKGNLRRHHSLLAEMLYALGHHGRSIKPLADMLVYGLVTSGKTLSGHKERSRYAIIDGATFYFYPKPGRDPRIEVRRKGFRDKTALRSERDILRWIKSLP